MRRVAMRALLLPAAALAVLACNGPGTERDPGQAGDESTEAREALDQVGSLPYVDAVTVPAGDLELEGVTRHDPERAWQGLNLYVTRPRPRAVLLDMSGRLRHQWESPVSQPPAGEAEILEFLGGWHHAEVGPNGNLFAIVENRALLELDSGSGLVRAIPLAAHHDLAFGPNGSLYVLAAREISVERGGRGWPVLDEEVIRLSPEGEVAERLSLHAILASDPEAGPALAALSERNLSVYEPGRLERALERLGRGRRGEDPARASRRADLLRSILDGSFQGSDPLRLGLLRNTPSDLLHANAVAVIGGGASPWPAGSLLVCIRNLDLVAVIDPGKKRVLWSWGQGTLERPHGPALLPGGNILVFDNGTRSRRSRIVEVDPRTGEVAWLWEGDPPGSFFSPIRGGVQELPNGNRLITDSERGRVFEITPEGLPAWEFFSPDRDRVRGTRVPIYRMTRYPEEILAGR